MDSSVMEGATWGATGPYTFVAVPCQEKDPARRERGNIRASAQRNGRAFRCARAARKSRAKAPNRTAERRYFCARTS